VSKKPYLVAVVDDDPSVRKALGRLIHIAGYRVESFPTGEQFLSSLHDYKPDCVVLDLHMPDMDGFEVKKLLAKIDPRVPVVVVTGHDTPESRSRMLAGGAKAYLCKPVDDKELLSAIESAISGR
jgi:FixJ family two-component response regulator